MILSLWNQNEGVVSWSILIMIDYDISLNCLDATFMLFPRSCVLGDCVGTFNKVGLLSWSIFLVTDFASATSTVCHSSRSTGVWESLAGGHLSPSLHCLLKLWTRVLLTELNFYSPAAGKSKKRKKRIPVLLIQKEKLWLLREELLVSRICRIQNTCYSKLVALTCYLN